MYFKTLKKHTMGQNLKFSHKDYFLIYICFWDPLGVPFKSQQWSRRGVSKNFLTVKVNREQMKKSWKHLNSDYAGLIGFDERWKTAYPVLGFLIRFSGHPSFRFFDFGKLPSTNRMCHQLEICPKYSEFNNLSKTVSFVEIIQREPKKFCLVTPKNVKNWHFW